MIDVFDRAPTDKMIQIGMSLFRPCPYFALVPSGEARELIRRLWRLARLQPCGSRISVASIVIHCQGDSVCTFPVVRAHG